MDKENLKSILDAARKLPPKEQRRLIEQLMKEALASLDQVRRALAELDASIEQLREHGGQPSDKTRRALEAVEKTHGSMKGLDRDTIIWLAEDEELCGY